MGLRVSGYELLGPRSGKVQSFLIVQIDILCFCELSVWVLRRNFPGRVGLRLSGYDLLGPRS